MTTNTINFDEMTPIEIVISDNYWGQDNKTIDNTITIDELTMQEKLALCVIMNRLSSEMCSDHFNFHFKAHHENVTLEYVDEYELPSGDSNLQIARISVSREVPEVIKATDAENDHSFRVNTKVYYIDRPLACIVDDVSSTIQLINSLG